MEKESEIHLSQIVNGHHWRLWSVALVVALILTTLAAFRIYIPGDSSIAASVQSAHGVDGLDYLSNGVYRFGLAPVYPLAALSAAGVAVSRRNLLAASFIGLAAAARPLGTVVKEIVERPRPIESGLLKYVENANGFSFPSGHVFGTVLLVGFVTFLLARAQQSATARAGVVAGGASFMLAMGLQRIYAGAHWPTDVIAGYLWGGLTLFVLIEAYRVCSHLFEARQRPVFARSQ